MWFACYFLCSSNDNFVSFYFRTWCGVLKTPFLGFTPLSMTPSHSWVLRMSKEMVDSQERGGGGGMCWGLLAKDQLRFKILKHFAKWVNLKKYNNWTWCDLFLPILYSFGLWTLECNWFQAYSASHLDLLRLYHARLRERVENMKPKF